jgi:hypothetical protein
VEYNRVLDFNRAREINLNIFKTAMRLRDSVPQEYKSSLYQQTHAVDYMNAVVF